MFNCDFDRKRFFSRLFCAVEKVIYRAVFGKIILPSLCALAISSVMCYTVF